jgi:hypothetical protein
MAIDVVLTAIKVTHRDSELLPGFSQYLPRAQF